jgi:hypothetical protein
VDITVYWIQEGKELSTLTPRLPTLFFILSLLSIPFSSTFAVPAEPGYRVDKTPQWVVQQRYDQQSPETSAQAVQYLLIDEQQRLLSDTTHFPPQYFNRFAMRLLNSAGLSQNSQFEITFNPAYQTLHLHSLKVIREGKSRELINQVYIRVVQREQRLDYDIHDGRITVVMIPDDLRVGDIIDYSYSLEGRNPIFGARHFGTFSLNWDVPVNKLSLRILTDSRQLKFRGVGLNVTPHESHTKGLKDYSLILTDVSQVKDDGETSPEHSPYAWLDYTEYDGWDEVNQWAKQLYSGVNTLTDQSIDTLANDLKRDARDRADYISRALFFVQNEIRYVGLELGVNSHRPRSPADVLKKRYGDCKDKSLLLVTLLKHEGIRAWPALVSTSFRIGIEKDLPNPGAFDHVITLVEFNGKKYWLDGTRLFQSGGLEDLGFSDYGFALVVGHQNSGLTRMYPNAKLSSRINVFEEITATDFNSAVHLNIKTIYHGNAAEIQRYQFQTKSINEIQRAYLEFYNRFYDTIQTEQAPYFEDDTTHNRFTIYESYKIDDYWKRTKSKIYSTIYNLSYLSTLKAPKVRQRKTPYYIGLKHEITSEQKIHYPKDVALNLDENPVNIENNALRYTYQDLYADSVYTHRSSLLIKNKDVALSDLDNYIKSLEEIRKDWEFTITVAESQTQRSNNDLAKLKNRLKILSQGHHE